METTTAMTDASDMLDMLNSTAARRLSVFRQQETTDLMIGCTAVMDRRLRDKVKSLIPSASICSAPKDRSGSKPIERSSMNGPKRQSVAFRSSRTSYRNGGKHDR